MDINDAIEWAKKWLHEKRWFNGTDEWKALNILITVAEQVRDVEMPKKKDGYDIDLKGYVGLTEREKGFNEAFVFHKISRDLFTPLIVKKDIEIEELKKINKDANTMIGVNCDELHKIIKEKDIEIEELKFGIREIVGRDFSEGAYLAKVEKYTALEARYYELQSKLKQKDIEIEEILNDTNAFQSELKTCKEEIEGYEIAKKDAFDYQFELEQENKRLREALVDINVNAMQRYKWKRDSNEDSKGWLLINMLASQAIISYQDKKGKE